MSSALDNLNTEALQTEVDSSKVTKDMENEARFQDLQDQISKLGTMLMAEVVNSGLAASGFVEWAVDDAVDIAAADLNAAAAGTFSETFTARLVISGTGETYVGCSLIPVLSRAYVNGGGGTGATPTVEGTPQCQAGELNVTVIFVTDANATKHYVAGDSFTVTLHVQLPGNVLDNTLLGRTVPAGVMTFNVV